MRLPYWAVARATVILAFWLAYPAARVSAAQTATGGLTGIVRDTASRPVAGVAVRATSLESGFEYEAATRSRGRYWLHALPPGRYEIEARAAQPRMAAVLDVTVIVGTTARVDLVLLPAPFELTPLAVEVGPQLEEGLTSEISYVLDRARIERLPEESRQFIELAELLPGTTAGTDATGGPPQFGGDGSTVGALNRQSLGVLVDGVSFTEGIQGDLSGALPLLAIREFEVIQGQYGADLGRAASGAVNVVTRRGANEPTIEGFGRYRHRNLNARGAFETEKPDFNRSHWGLAAGGSIARDRTHFFAAFERRVQNDFSTVNSGGAFPEREGTFRTPLIDNLIFARLDHRAGPSHELTLRYTGQIGEQLLGVGGSRAFENGLNSTIEMHGGLLAHRWRLQGDWLNVARLQVIDTRRGLGRNAPPGPMLVYPSLVAGPQVQHGTLGSLSVELRDDLSWIVAGHTGTHRLGVGAHLNWQHNEVHTNNFLDGRFDFATDTSSVPFRGIVTFEDAGIRLDARNLQLAFYASDDWSPAPELTVNLGLRYDIETNGSNQGFVSPFAGQLPFIRTTPRPIDANNLAPRLGFAWNPDSESNTIVRGAFGVFYDALVAGPLLAFERSSGVRTASIIEPETTDVDELMIDPDTVPPMLWVGGEEIVTPMTRQYSVGVRHSLSADVIVRIDGLLVQGRNLLLQRNLNPVTNPGDDDPVRRFPGYAGVRQILSEGRAEAKMLLLQARKTFSRGWLEVGYTLADRKNTNDTWSDLVPQTDIDGPDLDAEWGPAAWDERHRLVTTGGYDLPGTGLGLVARVVYASARPFTAVTGSDDNGDSARSNDRPFGEGRNARRGPDFLRTDLGATWDGITWGPARLGFEVNVYNLFNTTNGDPASVQLGLVSPQFGRPLAAFPKRQVEVGLRVSMP